MKKLLSMVLCLALLLSILPVEGVRAGEGSLLAFPGAEGFGAYTTGGRGGDVYHVTNLNPTGPGSFHEGITTGGDNPRTIVFDVSGYIHMPDLKTGRSNLTIAGQTAPGEGITIRGGTLHFSGAKNLVIRYMRFRRGQQEAKNDCLYIENCEDVIIDHCSFTWGNDEVLSIKGSTRVSAQWNIIAEGMLPHSMGGLIEWNTLSMHHNLYASNNDRNPKVKGYLDFVNNAIYNWGGWSFVAGDSAGLSYANVVGNYFVAGRDSVYPWYAIMRGNENFSLYLSNNRIDSNRNGIVDGTDTGTAMIEEDRPCTLVEDRFAFIPLMNMESPEAAYAHVMEKAGASLCRDAVDGGIIERVRNQSGRIIDHEDKVGGFLPIEPVEAPADSDGDGMPDVWETGKGLNPQDPGDGSLDRNGDRYTNLEEYLNELAAPGFPEGTPMAPPPAAGPLPTLPPTSAPTPAPTPAPSSTPGYFRFDFGTTSSPVEIGYTGITNLTAYSPTQMYGWADITLVDTRNRSTTDKLRTDFCNAKESTKPIVFKVDVPNGEYDVKVISGDQIASNNTTLSINGGVSDSLISAAGEFAEKTYTVDVTEGQLNLVFGGVARVNAVEIRPALNDSAPPEVPSGLSVVSVSGTAVDLVWQPAERTVSYNVYRASASDSTYRMVGTSVTESFTDTGLAPVKTYFYRISAVNDIGESKLSDAIAAVTTPLPVPTGFKVGNTSDCFVALSWKPVSGIARFYIYRSPERDGIYERIGNAKVTSYIDYAVSPGTTYYYKITSVILGTEEGDAESEPAGIVKATTIPSVPTGLAAGPVTASSVEINWIPVTGAVEYRIYRALVGRL